jgi:hypothetical protein
MIAIEDEHRVADLLEGRRQAVALGLRGDALDDVAVGIR